MNKFKHIVSVFALLVYTASTLWITAFHSHESHSASHDSDLSVIIEVGNTYSNEYLESSDDHCASCHFLTHQEANEISSVEVLFTIQESFYASLNSFELSNNLNSFTGRAPPVLYIS